MCVFDIVGKNGEVYNMMEKYKTSALKWGVKLELKPYTDEVVAMEDFQSGQCDGVVLTGLRNRKLVKFAGSLDMMGALPTYDHLERAIKALLRPKARQYLQTKRYEVAGIFPAGAIYLYARPQVMKEIDGTPTVEDLAGRKIAVMSYDQQALAMARHVGASAVPADITNFGGKFNNGSVELCYGPAAAYDAMELYKGLGEKGRVIDYILAQLTYQITLRRDEFPRGFVRHSKDWTLDNYSKMQELVHSYEEQIPDDKWITIPEKDITNYQNLFRKVRQQLLKEGVYDKRMVQLLKRIRCNMNPTLAECTMN